MGGGSPDYTKTTKIMANFGGVLVPVAVDAAGQLYALLKGFDGATYVPISVDADGRLVAVMTGSDGVAPRVLLTDAEGRLISVIQDPVSGFNVGVDSDGFMTTIIKGADGATLRTLKVDGSGRLVGTIVDATTGDSASVDTNGYLTSVMKGVDGAVLRTIAVDDNGNIVGVFKGEYGGALKTVATDVDGRIIAIMVDPLNIRGVRPVVGSGELAARLGSPVSYERRGTVMFVDDFGCGVSKSYFETVGVGSDAIISADRGRTSGYCAKLTSGTAGGAYARVYHSTDLWQYSGLMGLECHLGTTGGTHLIQIQLWVYDGINYHNFGIQWDQDTEGINYLNSLGNWIASGMGIDAVTTIPSFHSFKLIVDLDSTEYIRLYFGSNLYDMDGLSGLSTGSALPPVCHSVISVIENGGGVTEDLYVSDVIITIAEPAS